MSVNYPGNPLLKVEKLCNLLLGVTIHFLQTNSIPLVKVNGRNVEYVLQQTISKFKRRNFDSIWLNLEWRYVQLWYPTLLDNMYTY